MRVFSRKIFGRKGYCAVAGLLVLLVVIMSCRGPDDSLVLEEETVPWPSWVFEHWVWYGESTQDEAIELVQDYLAHDIPVGGIIIDSPWETGYNTFEFDLALYPDPQGMVDWFHDNDVHVVLWITSVINAMCETGCEPDCPPCPEEDLFNEGMANHYFMGDGTLIPWWKCPGGETFCGALIDYFNPDALDWWHSLMDPILDLGIDGWKCDGADPFALLALISPYAGPTKPWEYTDRYYRDTFEYTRERLGTDRIIMSRSVDSILDFGDIGFGDISLAAPFGPREVTFAGWVGDQDPTFEGMQVALTNMYMSAQANYLLFGSDIGGYGGGPSKEVMIRWVQLGAMCSLMENGGNGEHRPWMFDEETLDIYRKFVKLHYKLIPYMQEQAKIAWKDGTSLMKPQKGDNEIWKWEYLLGSDILVAPMYESGNLRTVKFPEGDDWVYLWDRSNVYPGGSVVTVNAPLSKFPIFLRKGSPIESDPDLP